MGSVFRRKFRDPATGEVRECETWTIRYWRLGKRYEESAGTIKKTEAVALLKLREGAIAKGEHIIAPALQRQTVAEALAVVEQDYVLKGLRSLADTKRRVKKHVVPFFEGRRLVDVTANDIVAYQMHRKEEGAQPSTINREVAVLRRAFTLARKAGMIHYIPVVEQLREDNARQSFFEPEQLDALVKQLSSPLADVAKFAYYTGWRIRSEVLPLEWRQVDRNVYTIRLDPGTTKNNKPRVFTYGQFPQLKALMEARWAVHEALKASGTLCPLVFHRDGRKIRSYDDAWDTACKKAGLAGKVPHDLRRSAVRNLVRAGVPQHTAMSMTGHMTPEVFRRYNIVSEADQQQAAAALGAYLGGDSGAGRKQGDR